MSTVQIQINWIGTGIIASKFLDCEKNNDLDDKITASLQYTYGRQEVQFRGLNTKEVFESSFYTLCPKCCVRKGLFERRNPSVKHSIDNFPPFINNLAHISRRQNAGCDWTETQEPIMTMFTKFI